MDDVKQKSTRRLRYKYRKTIFTVRDFAKLAFKCVNLDYKKFVKVDKKLERPADVQTLLGSCSKAKRILKWKPKYNFQGLVNDMVKADIEFVKKYGY